MLCRGFNTGKCNKDFPSCHLLYLLVASFHRYLKPMFFAQLLLLIICNTFMFRNHKFSGNLIVVGLTNACLAETNDFLQSDSNPPHLPSMTPAWPQGLVGYNWSPLVPDHVSWVGYPHVCSRIDTQPWSGGSPWCQAFESIGIWWHSSWDYLQGSYDEFVEA